MVTGSVTPALGFLRRVLPAVTTLLAWALCAGCAGSQSALSAIGEEAGRVGTLFWIMTFGAVLVTALVLGATAVALRGGAPWRRGLGGETCILGLGMALPIAVLSALLLYGFGMLRPASGVAVGDGVLRVAVEAEQWWWRVTYLQRDGTRVETANELRIPIGEPVLLELTTADVIHSFWVPALAGKVDMIPGVTNQLRLLATEGGIVRGQCAEYCGGAHALMAFYVVATEVPAFDQWLAAEGTDAATGEGEPGFDLFLASGCGGCHRIRGTAARGPIGPDLTHVGGRISLGAGVLGTSVDDFDRWLRAHHQLKPGNRMPPFEHLTDDDYEQLADFLAGLE